MNTFIELALDVMPKKKVRKMLLTFMKYQNKNDWNIPDGIIRLYLIKYKVFKNTVETD